MSLQDLKLALEEQRGHVADLSSSLEREKQISAQLREQVDGQQAREVGVSSELQVRLLKRSSCLCLGWSKSLSSVCVCVCVGSVRRSESSGHRAQQRSRERERPQRTTAPAVPHELKPAGFWDRPHPHAGRSHLQPGNQRHAYR